MSLQQVWAIGIAKSLRGGGIDLETCCEASRFLEALDPKELEKDFAKERTCLLIMRIGEETTFLPRLVLQESIVGNVRLKKQKKEAERKGLAFMFTCIDVKPMLDLII